MKMSIVELLKQSANIENKADAVELLEIFGALVGIGLMIIGVA